MMQIRISHNMIAWKGYFFHVEKGGGGQNFFGTWQGLFPLSTIDRFK